MSKRSAPGADPRAEAWFEAATRYDQLALGALIDEGFDVDCRDRRGRTALFYAISPSGGVPEMVRWLVSKGADVNILDEAGESALDFGWRSISSALEANMMQEAKSVFCQHGYRPSPKTRAAEAQIEREQESARERQRKRTRSDFWGTWVVHGGVDDGHKIRISSRRIESDLVWMRLEVDEVIFDERGRLQMHGEHATELVHVTILIRKEREAILRWSDGIMGPLPDIHLRRP